MSCCVCVVCSRAQYDDKEITLAKMFKAPTAIMEQGDLWTVREVGPSSTLLAVVLTNHPSNL